MNAAILLTFFFVISVLSTPSIVLVGTSRAGTTSFHQLFEELGLESAHHGIAEGAVYSPIAVLLGQAHLHGKPLLQSTEGYDALCEINNIELGCYFPQLEPGLLENLVAQYPEVLYIFNTRSVEKQARSIEAFRDGQWSRDFPRNCGRYLKDYKGDNMAVTTQFLEHFNQRIRSVFANSTAIFVEFNIDNPDMDAPNRFIGTKGIPFPLANQNPNLQRDRVD